MIDLSLSSRAFAALFAVTLVAACGDDGKTTATEASGASTSNATTDGSTDATSTTDGTSTSDGTTDDPTTTNDVTTTTTDSTATATTTTTDGTTTTTTDSTATTTTTTDGTTTTTTDGTTTTTTGDGLSFAADVYPIIMANCSCHVGGAPAGLSMSSAATAYDNLVDVPSSQPNMLDRIEPGDPDASHLFKKVTGTQTTGQQMPLGGMPLQQADLDTIEQWIADGALP